MSKESQLKFQNKFQDLMEKSEEEEKRFKNQFDEMYDQDGFFLDSKNTKEIRIFLIFLTKIWSNFIFAVTFKIRDFRAREYDILIHHVMTIFYVF